MSNHRRPHDHDAFSIEHFTEKFATLVRNGNWTELEAHLAQRPPAFDLDQPLNGTGSSALHIAATIGHDDVVRLLLAEGANPDVVDYYDRTPLMEAAANNAEVVARELLVCMADINRQDLEHRTALFRAVQEGSVDVARLLLACGANQSIADTDGLMPQDKAFAQGNISMENLLRDAPQVPELPWGIRLDREQLLATNREGYSLLDNQLVWMCFSQIAAMLQQHGDQLHKEDLLETRKYGYPPMVAVIRGGALSPVLKMLQSQGEALTAEEWLAKKPGENMPYLLREAMQCYAVPAIFRHENWRGQRAEDMQKVYSALPSDVRESVHNFRALFLTLQREDVAQNKQQGRA